MEVRQTLLELNVPHLLKLSNNYFRDFVLSNGKSGFEELLNLNSGQDIKFAHKFTNQHLLVEGTGLMKEKLAAQLFSYTISKAIEYIVGKKLLDKYNWKEASEIVLLFNDWFDLFNTQYKFDKRVKSYGLDETTQNDLLDKITVLSSTQEFI